MKIKGIWRFHPYIIFCSTQNSFGGFYIMSKETIGKHAATCDRVVEFFIRTSLIRMSRLKLSKKYEPLKKLKADCSYIGFMFLWKKLGLSYSNIIENELKYRKLIMN